MVINILTHPEITPIILQGVCSIYSSYFHKIEQVATWSAGSGLETEWNGLFLNDRPNFNQRVLSITSMEVSGDNVEYDIVKWEVKDIVCGLVKDIASWEVKDIVSWNVKYIVCWEVKGIVSWEVNDIVCWDIKDVVSWEVKDIVGWEVIYIVSWEVKDIVSWEVRYC